jgi:hypothetical protein
MTNRYVVGGVAFLSNEYLAGLETSGFADIDLRVHFSLDFESRAADRSDARAVAGPTGTSGVVEPDTLECWLPDLVGDPRQRAWHLRQMAPAFGAAVGRLVLHAGAVTTSTGIVGLMGESGAGKSTLVRFLTDGGHTLVADDLLPVRFIPEASSPAGIRLLPLSALFLLTRSNTADVRAERLDPLPALRGLVEQGFGEHGDPDAWAFQFDAYHRLADAVPIFSLTIPDDLDALPRVRDAIVSLVSGNGIDPSIGGAS